MSSQASWDERIARLPLKKRALLLRWIEDGSTAEAGPSLVPRPEARHEPFPLTEVQEAYWAGRSGLFDLGGGGSNLHMDFEAEGPWEILIDRLHEILRRSLERHDQLRMVVLPDGRQRVLPLDGLRWEIGIQDLRGLDGSEQEARIDELRESLCRVPAPIDRFPLFDVVAQRLDERRIHLHTRFDALAMDGESRLMLVQEMMDLFEGASVPAPKPACTYRDFALARSERRETVAYAEAREHWSARIQELPPPPDLPLVCQVGPSTPPAFSRRKSVLLEPEPWQKFRQVCAARAVTPSLVLTAAFVEALSHWNGGRAFTFCMIRSNRSELHPDLPSVLGNFGDISVVGGEVNGRFIDRALDLQRKLVEDQQHKEFTGFEVVREWNRRRGPGPRVSLPVWFNSVVEFAHTSFRKQVGRREATGPAGTLRFVDTVLYPPQTLLMATVGVGWSTGDLRCSWQATEGLLEPGLVGELAERFGRLVTKLTDNEAAWDGLAGGAVSTDPVGAPARIAADRLEAAAGRDAGGDPALPPSPVLARAWLRLLGRDPSGPDEHFFDAGGDSIAAARLVATLRRDLGYAPPAEVLFGDGTFGGISAWLARAGSRPD